MNQEHGPQSTAVDPNERDRGAFTTVGAVVSIVEQIARRKGRPVVGLTDADDKVSRCVAEFDYHAARSCPQRLPRERLQALFPHGIYLCFDNTSGDIDDAVCPRLHPRSRFIQCGTTAVASRDPPPTGSRRDREILVKRLLT